MEEVELIAAIINKINTKEKYIFFSENLCKVSSSITVIILNKTKVSSFFSLSSYARGR